jgi:non-heme chloroperoxidase
MPYVRLRDGQRLHVRVLGRGAPCVLVHGFASDGSSWLPFIAPLLHRYRFLVPDLRGFGQSRALTLSSACPLTVYAEDLACLAESFSLEAAPLVAISMGALSAVRGFELGLGERFARYMHIDQGLAIHNEDAAGHGLLGAAQAGFFARIEALLELLARSNVASYRELSPPLQRELAAIFAQFASAAFSRSELNYAVRQIAQWPSLLPLFLPSAGFATHVQIMRAYLERRYDLRAAFARVPARTTVLIGGASRMYPAAGQRITSRLSAGVRVRELASVGHLLPLEAPREFLRELRAFLA